MTTSEKHATSFQPHEEDVLRASLYAFLGRILSQSPTSEVLELAQSFSGDDTGLGKAFDDLAKVAQNTSVETAEREYLDLFVGLSRGELLPYSSYYLTGFLNEKPLAKLRNTISVMGIERSDEVKEPEDHIAALCDMMAGLITGRFDAPATLEVQKKFFADHIGNWASHFFEDLEKAEYSSFYKPVGRIGKEFMIIEATSFGMS